MTPRMAHSACCRPGTSNKLPVAVAMRISRDWPRAKTEVEKYERDYADDPNVQNASPSGSCHSNAGTTPTLCQAARASRPELCLVSIVGCGLQRTANKRHQVERNARQGDRASLDGSRGASIQNEIARKLLQQKDYRQAVTYADNAAESYSAWSMLTAVRCHEMLGEWKTAEQLVARSRSVMKAQLGCTGVTAPVTGMRPRPTRVFTNGWQRWGPIWTCLSTSTLPSTTS